MFWAYTWMSPERVSVGEEGEDHSMSMDPRQKKHGNQQESGSLEYQKQSNRERLREGV